MRLDAAVWASCLERLISASSYAALLAEFAAFLAYPALRETPVV